MKAEAPCPVAHEPADDVATYLSLSRFLYAEARLLDERRYRAWLGLLDPEISYWMPGIQSRFAGDPTAELNVRRMSYFEDRLANLETRVKRFESPMAWAEDPPTRFCHVVTNVEVEATSRPGDYRVRSVVALHRNRNETEETHMVGRREDIIRATEAGWRLAERTVVILQAVLLYKNINTFL